jgi:hypothetical protein
VYINKQKLKDNMIEKYNYAPGMPGFGSKGKDGSAGLQGLSMFFTDYDPISDVNAINSKISSNYSLWSGTISPLPDGRVYVTGDLFFDSNGKAYEINAETNTFSYKYASLNTGGFFVPLGISTDGGYARYFNSNSTPKYIIDNVYSESGSVDYTLVPQYIYGIEPYNYARIEFSNILLGKYNPFTLFTTGNTEDTALAIVRDSSANEFHIGNLNYDGKIRNVNLVFDVSSLRQTKETGNSFTVNTPAGTILTNNEINANSLFDNNFVSKPSSFYAIFNSGTNDCSVYWNLADFTNDPTTTGALYFYQHINTYTGNTYRIDSSALRPLILDGLDSSGKIKITGLSASNTYSCYIKLSKNGWTRTSDVLTVFGGTISAVPVNSIESYTAHDVSGFDVNTNVPWSWSIITNPNSMIYNVTSTSTNSLDGSLYCSLASNPGTSRVGKIRFIAAGGAYTDVSITQQGSLTTVYYHITYDDPIDMSSDTNLDVYKLGTLTLTNMPTNLVVDVSILLTSTVVNANESSNTVQFSNTGTATTHDFTWNDSGNLAQNLTSIHSNAINLTGLSGTGGTLNVPLELEVTADCANSGILNYSTKLELTDVSVHYYSGDNVAFNKFGGIYGSVEAAYTNV